MSPLVGRPPLEGADLTGRALLLLAAVLLASAPVSQLLAGSSWLVLTLLGAAPVVLGGIVLRGVLRPLMLVPLAQAGLIGVLVLVVETVLGLIRWQDGPVAVMAAQAGILGRGAGELATGVAPLDPGARGTVIVVALIALMTLLLDLMFLDLGWHTPTALLLLCSVLLPAVQQPAGGIWWHVAAPVLAGAMVLATRTVHADPRRLRGDRRPQAGPLAHPVRTLAAAALCTLLVAGLTPLLGAALPQLAPARIALSTDLLQRWQDPNASSLGAVMIDDDVSVRRSLLQREDTEVLRFTTTAEQPSYLRLRALNSFDGETFRADAEGEEPALGVRAFSDARDDGTPVRGSAEDLVITRISIRDLAGDRLPVPANVRSVQGPDRALDRAMSLHPSNGELALGPVREGLIGQRYTVESEPRTSTPEQLRAVDPAEFERPFEVGYTSRDEVPAAASVLADQLVAEAGAQNAFDAAVAFQDYFRSSFAYSLTVSTPPGEDPLESFLEDRIGYCEQFAAAFALMMTSQGYPARVVIGFTPGSQDGEEWSVTAKNAHAWPEVWFGPVHGWVRFEPTPAAAANGVRPPVGTDASQRGRSPGTPPTPAEPEAPGAAAPGDEGPSSPQTTEDASGAGASDGGGLVPSAATLERLEGGVVGLLALGALLAAAAALSVVLVRLRRVRAREQRWAALLGGADGERSGREEGPRPGDGAGPGHAPGPGSAAGDGSGPGLDGEREGAGTDRRDPALAAERMRRRAGELAWSELTRELAVRERAIRWLGITGAWGRPPARLRLRASLPPQRALDDLLDQVDAGDLEVTPEHRAAAARIAEAFTAAIYAAPLPEDGGPPAHAGPDGGSGRTGIGPGPSSAPRGTVTSADRPRHPLRHDADVLVELLRTAR